MGVGSVTRIDTVNIIIRIQGGQATRELSKLDRQVRKTNSRLDRFIRTISRPFIGQIRTLVKAITSMFGVLIVWNALLVPVEIIFSQLRDTIVSTFQAVADFEERAVGLQAILASFVPFRTDPVENFKVAGEVAIAVLDELILRNRETIASIQETALAFQTMIATGAQRYVKTVKDGVEVALQLSNAIAAITTGQDRSRQIAEETRSLFTGQFRAQSLLVRLMFRTRKELTEFLREAERNGDFAERFAKKMDGFIRASGKLALTLGGVKATLQSLQVIVAREGFFVIFDEGRRKLSEFVNGLIDMKDELASASAVLGGAFRTAVDLLLKVANISSDLMTPSGLLKFINDKLPGKLAEIFTSLERTAEVLKIIGSLLLPLGRILINTLQAAFAIIVAIFNRTVDLGQLIVLILSLIPGGTFLVNLIDKIGNVLAHFVPPELQNQLLDLKQAVLDFGVALVQAKGDLDRFLVANRDARAAEIEADIRAAAEHIKQLRQKTNRDALNEELAGFEAFDFERFLRNAQLDLRKASINAQTLTATLRELKFAADGVAAIDLPEAISRTLEAMEGAKASLDILKELRFQVDQFKLSNRDLLDEEQLKQLDVLLAQIGSRIAGIESNLEAARGALVRLTDVDLSTLVDFIGNRIKFAFLDTLTAIAQNTTNFSQNLATSIVPLFKQLLKLRGLILFAIGQAFADAFQKAIEGSESFGKALLKSIRSFVGDVIIAFGQMLLAAGLAAVGIGILTGDFKKAAEGAAAVAQGLALIALGTLIKGSGGGASTAGSSGGGGGTSDQILKFAFDQSQIDVQQGISAAAESLQLSADSISTFADNLKSIPEGVLVKDGQILKKATKEAQSNVTAGREFGAAVSGRGSSGGF